LRFEKPLGRTRAAAASLAAVLSRVAPPDCVPVRTAGADVGATRMAAWTADSPERPARFAIADAIALARK
jgi:hypothetical protein